MDTTVLIENKYEEGKRLIKKLDEQGNKYPIVFWMNMPEENEWMLIFGIPRLNTTGSKNIFRTIHNVINKNKIDISLNNVTLVDSSSSLCQNLKALIGKTGFKIGKTTFFGNIINDQRFPDSIIYRVN